MYIANSSSPMVTAWTVVTLLCVHLTAGAVWAAASPRAAFDSLIGATGDSSDICVADCDGNGVVSVDELLRGVAIALDGAAIVDCAAFDCDHTGRVSIDCLVKGVDAALNGCPEIPLSPVTSCAGLSQLSVPDVQIKSAALVAAAGSVPEHCVVEGEIGARTGVTNPDTGSDMYGTNFELRLPTQWLGRFFYQGGFGTDGLLASASGAVPGAIQTPALWQGFAVVSSDAGHESSPLQAGFGVDPQARIDMGYNSIGQVTPVAKGIIAAYYGRPPHHSYFLGCSKGGQEAMQASQRYGDQFDGIVAGDPGFNLPRAAIAEAWNTQAFAAAAEAVSPGSIDADGNPLLYAGFSPTALQLVADAVLHACDALDGLGDHIIFNLAACAFDPVTLQCSDAASDTCLTAAQVTALRTVFGGPADSQGHPLYADWPYDSGIGASWAAWTIGGPAPSGAPANNALNVTLGLAASRYLFVTPPDPSLSMFSVSMDAFASAIAATGVDPSTGIDYAASAIEFMTADSTQLDTFRNHGGKLILYHGQSDPVFSVNDTVRYYRALSAAYGSATPDFARLFLVPGMTHCFGGDYALDGFETLAPIVSWVERGQAPDALVATSSSTLLPAGISRPLCAYPAYAQYDGSGATDSAASFRCVAPGQ